MNVAVYGAFQKLVLDSRMDSQHIRVVLEHLIEIVLRIQLANTLDRHYTSNQQLFGRSRIGSKITHRILLQD